MIPKYRAWDKRTKLMNDVTTIDLEKEIVFYHHWKYGHSKAISFKDVELLQSTGLKDNNGVEIYEGDIVIEKSSLMENYEAKKFVVVWNEWYCSFNLSTAFNYEVIGNKFEHPHLIKE